jgi:hypothetical protein
MEILACREGLALASDVGLQNFRLAYDCINVVKTIQGGSLGPAGNVIKEIRDTLKLFLRPRLCMKEERRMSMLID